MDYYKILNFKMEPFSNSPDPGLFYSSAQHLEALQKLEISIRLKRGLNIITGDIGTGKTTISRQLIQRISLDESIKFYLILDPGFSSTIAFLKYLLHLFEPGKTYDSDDENILKENVKEHLFTNGVDQNINIVLIIDEGQKLSLPCIEILRELLNFETNDQKLLQIIIFAQKEFTQSLEQIVNFQDRINFYYKLNPLNFNESKNLIDYRLEKCFITGKTSTLFTPSAYFLIYMATKGFPRRIVTLCHQIMLSLIIKNKTKADIFFVRSCIKKAFPKKRLVRPVFLFIFFLFLVFGSLYAVNTNKITLFFDQFSSFTQKSVEPETSKPTIRIKELSDKNKTPDVKAPETKPQPKIESAPVIKMPAESNKDLKTEPLPSEKTEPLNGSATKPGKPSDASAIKPDDPVDSNTAVTQTPKILKMPEAYGTLKVPENATLARLIRIIYGSFRYSYLNKLLKFNTSLNDPNNVKAGMNINFPVIESPDDPDDKTIFIVLFETDNFEKSFITAHNYPTTDFNVRILPVWRNENGFLFPVVINKPFYSMTAAEKYKKNLPEIIFAACKPLAQIKNNGKK